MDTKEYPELPLQKEIIQAASEFPEYEIAHKGQMEVQSVSHQRRSRINYLFSGGANFVKQQAISVLEGKDKDIVRLKQALATAGNDIVNLKEIIEEKDETIIALRERLEKIENCCLATNSGKMDNGMDVVIADIYKQSKYK